MELSASYQGAMDPLLKKMHYKGQAPMLILGAPDDFSSKAFGKSDRKPKGRYPFVFAFAKSMAEAKKSAKQAPKLLGDSALFWMAYPKGSSKKYKGADLNRDTLHSMMESEGFEGVSLVAVDEDWSAMRFKVKA
jgi:hypothetical protein